jgi:hypothetical protein
MGRGDGTHSGPIGAGNKKTALFRAARGEDQFKRKYVSWPSFLVALKKIEQLSTLKFANFFCKL